jgi:hypothetical protein
MKGNSIRAHRIIMSHDNGMGNRSSMATDYGQAGTPTWPHKATISNSLGWPKRDGHNIQSAQMEFE